MDKSQLDRLLQALGAMREAEAAVADFYLACAERWKGEAAFFLARAEEEDSHAQGLAALAAIVSARPFSFFPGRGVERESILAFTAFALRQAALVRDGSLDLPSALAEARTLEESILESRLEELVRGTDSELTPVLSLLREQTRAHRDQLQRKLEEVRGKARAGG